MVQSKHYVNDALHGIIEMGPKECEVTQTPTFQRLSRINQTGLGNLVFPGATHSRASHCLGAMHNMGRVLEHLGKLDKGEVELLRMSALLHDIGQYPLSHTIEAVYKKLASSSDKWKELRDRPYEGHHWLQLAADSPPDDDEANKASDKNMARDVLSECEDLKRVLSDPKYIDRIANIINGKEKRPTLYKQLMDSAFDVDRLDYIPRDTLATGVEYGGIELSLIQMTSCLQ